MARPPKERRVEYLPAVTVFKPAGLPKAALEEVVLTVEELEAVRLKDLERMEQEDCAAKMRISRPTFQRILGTARAKIADALINGKGLRIEGGNYQLAGGRFQCQACLSYFDLTFPHGRPVEKLVCPRCEHPQPRRVEGGAGPGRRSRGRHGRRGPG
ncbi:MAG TPA: DUF134 domain-containing protein [Firmicutes bacterium]|nr:DUF134 domain-containing protein [Bacillota bacterium]